MRLMRIGEAGRERPAVWVDEGHYVDVSDQFGDFDEAFFDAAGIERVRVLAGERAAAGGCPRSAASGSERRSPARTRSSASGSTTPTTRRRPARRTGRADRLQQGAEHADRPERRRATPSRQRQDRLGGRARRRDRQAKVLPCDDADAPAAIAGYTLVNDVSERAFQNERGGQWVKGKSAETFNPAGPVAGHPGRDRGRARPRCGSTSTGCAGRTARPRHDLQPALHRPLPQPVHGARARRPHRHRDPAGVGRG